MWSPPTEHRPWPAPRGPWVMTQRWHDVLFAHWPVAADDVRRLVPSALQLDTYDGVAWVGVVPFRMSGVRARWLPSVPWLSAFPELNVRTYVLLGDKPGVFFFSLDAGNRVAAAVARRWYHLPYFHAHMSVEHPGNAVGYRSQRIQRSDSSAQFVGHYRPTGEMALPAQGSLAHWLTARYCLYAVDPHGVVYRGEIAHAPWPLQPAAAAIDRNTMADAAGLRLTGAPSLLHFARLLDVAIWPLTPVSRSEG
ncbi:MAG: DUF2071 domain-containing protein [Chloroflexi bacterium]|nr:DUF2071 domain-containing protein [Chloroflexota bacterium]